MSGKWFIREEEIYLRIDRHAEGGVHGFGPGMALVFEIKAVGPEAIRLKRPGSESDVAWKRIPEQTGPGSGPQPSYSETNRPSSPAGSRR